MSVPAARPPQHRFEESDEEEIMLKPRPRGRPFELASEPPSAPPTPPSDTGMANSQTLDGGSTPARTRSILNLTSSTLFGIYQPTGYVPGRDEPNTPWGTGAQTPVDSPGSPNGSFDFTKSPRIPGTVIVQGPNGHFKRRRSTITPAQLRPRHRRKGFKGYVVPVILRLSAMFGMGLGYSVLISHLHDHQQIAPVKVTGLDRHGWPYLTFWGVMAVALGEGMPSLDRLWAPEDDDDSGEEEKPPRSGHGSGDWLDVVRAIGAFVGIAFAIRKTEWHSTMQLSLTLALVNPALWYLLDRSAPGFLMSLLVSICGTALMLGTNPDLVPPPAQLQPGRASTLTGNGTSSGNVGGSLVLGVFSEESIGVATWIASVLFVSTVCFGNIGRRLQPSDR